MDNVIKISLTIQLEGSTLVRQSNSEMIKYSIAEGTTSKQKKNKDGHKVVKSGEHIHYPLKSKPALLKINMGKEAFDYMTSKECPPFSKPKVWFKMTEKERLEAHLKRVCAHHRGKSFTYIVLED